MLQRWFEMSSAHGKLKFELTEHRKGCLNERNRIKRQFELKMNKIIKTVLVDTVHLKITIRTCMYVEREIRTLRSILFE